MPRHTLVPRERSYRGQSSGNDGVSFVRVGWGFLALGGLAVIAAVPQLVPFVLVPGGIIGAWALREKRTRPAKDIVVDEDDDPWVSSFGMQHVRAAFAAAADPPLKDRVKSY